MHGIVFILALILVPHRLAYSHDVWLLPEQFILSQGDVLTVHVRKATRAVNLPVADSAPFQTCLKSLLPYLMPPMVAARSMTIIAMKGANNP